MSITESLTKRRVVELKKAREVYDFKNVWPQDGKILFLDVKVGLSRLIKFLPN